MILFLGQTQGAGRRKTFQSLPYPESASVIGCDDSSNLSRRLYSSALSSCRRLSPFLKVPGSNSVAVVRVLVRLHSIAAPHQVFLTSSLFCSALLSSPQQRNRFLFCCCCRSFWGIMATATACASTAFAGQTVLKQVSELASKVGSSEARVQMRGSRSKSSGSIWSVSD